MKNLQGDELPFSNHEEKRQWYAARPQVVHPIAIIDKEKMVVPGGVRGKDDVFWYLLIPLLNKLGVHTILDVGGGQGRIAAFFDQVGMEVTTSEITIERADVLRESLNEHGFDHVKVITQDIEDTEEIGTYDLIFMSDIIEHLIDWRSCLANVAESCKYCYVLVPGKDSWKWSPDHLHYFDVETITEIINIFDDIEFVVKREYDEDNYWYALLLKGFVE
jgi:SAM-dependent methyltransferase